MLGVLVLGFLLLVRPSEAWNQDGISVWGSVVLFVFSSLRALAMISAHQTLAVERVRDVHVPSLSREWLTVVGLVVLAVVLVGWVTAEILSPESVKEILRLLSPIWIVIRTALMYVWLAIAYVLFWLLGPLMEFISGAMADNWEQATEGLRERSRRRCRCPSRPAAGLDPALLMALRIIRVTLLVVGLAALLLCAAAGSAAGTTPPISASRCSRGISSHSSSVTCWRACGASRPSRRSCRSPERILGSWCAGCTRPCCAR